MGTQDQPSKGHAEVVFTAAKEPFSLEAAGISPGGNAPRGVVLARLLGLADGRPLILLRHLAGPILASTTASLADADVGNLVCVLFLDGNLQNPVVIGPLAEAPPAGVPIHPPARLELQAGTELVLRCGGAALRLLSDGTAILRGVNVTTRAAATNRIRGGNVQIN